MTTTRGPDGRKDGGQHGGGGPQGEPIEGSLTDGGSLPGYDETDEDRAFGAGRSEREDRPSKGGEAAD